MPEKLPVKKQRKIIPKIWLEMRANVIWDAIKYPFSNDYIKPMIIATITTFVGWLINSSALLVNIAVWVVTFLLSLFVFLLVDYRRRKPTAIEQLSLNDIGEPLRLETDERIFTNISPEELAQFYEEHTAAQADKLFEVFIGKWITISLVVSDVHTQSSKGKVYHLQVLGMKSDNKFLQISASSSKQKWIDQTQILKRGEIITVAGKIEFLMGSRTLFLNDCELEAISSTQITKKTGMGHLFEKPLDIEFKEIYLICPFDFQDFSTFYITVVLKVTNQKPENVTIKSCRLFLDRKAGRVEGEFQKNTYLKAEQTGQLGDTTAITESNDEDIVFSQGIPQKYVKSFKFVEEDAMFTNQEGDDFADKSFVIQLTDSYRNEYEIQDRTDKDFMKVAGYIHS